MKNTLRFSFICSCIALVSACATPMQSGSQCVVEPGYFDELLTYSWRAQDGFQVDDETGFVSPIVKVQLREAIEQEIAKKGISKQAGVAQSAMEISVSLVTRRELQSFEVDDNNCLDCWEPVAPDSNTRMTLRTVGFLAIDVFVEDKPVWRSWVERNLYPADRDDAHIVLAEAVPRLLAEFPPK